MWTGTIGNGMHEKIEAEFDKAKDGIKRVDLYLNSCGGNIGEMEATIASLRHIKKTHRLETEWDGPMNALPLACQSFCKVRAAMAR